jgi:Zn-dependent peptidase ImmA (M78 family)
MRSRPNARIEVQAHQLLKESDSLRLPVPLERVAAHLGLQVEEAILGEDVSGVLVVAQGKGTIGVNSAHAHARQRFSIAHEIGHFILHQTKASLFIDKTYTVYRRDERSSTGEDLQEIQANKFAAALLMPEALVRQEVAKTGFDLGDETELASLADTFEVSTQAMSFRLANLNLLDTH